MLDALCYLSKSSKYIIIIEIKFRYGMIALYFQQKNYTLYVVLILNKVYYKGSFALFFLLKLYTVYRIM